MRYFQREIATFVQFMPTGIPPNVRKYAVVGL